MFVTKKKYDKLKDEIKVLKSDILFRKQISMMKDKKIEELKESNIFKTEIIEINHHIIDALKVNIECLKDEVENSLDHEELMSAIHEEHTAV